MIVETFFLAEEKRSMRTRTFQDLLSGTQTPPEMGNMPYPRCTPSGG
jgi:hypothetical protein